MEQFKKILTTVAEDTAKRVEKETKEKLIKEFTERTTKLIKDNGSWTESDATLVNNILLVGLKEIETNLETVEIDEAVLEPIDEEIKRERSEAKMEAIPESLKVFVNEKGEIITEKLEKVNEAIAATEAEKEFEEFKQTEFVKSLGEDAKISVESFNELKGIVSKDILKGIMENEIKGNKILEPLFIVPIEEDTTIDEDESGFNAVTHSSDEEAAVFEKELDKSIDEILKDKLERLSSKGQEAIDSFDQDRFKEETREKLIKDFVSTKQG